MGAAVKRFPDLESSSVALYDISSSWKYYEKYYSYPAGFLSFARPTLCAVVAHIYERLNKKHNLGNHTA